MVKTFTLAQILDAIEENGLPQAFGAYYLDEVGNRVSWKNQARSACALGMAAINLKVNASRLQGSLGEFASTIVYLNDSDRKSFKEIADRMREIYKDHLDKEIIVFGS